MPKRSPLLPQSYGRLEEVTGARCMWRRYESSAPKVAASQTWETSASFQTQSLAFLDKLASRYASSPALVAIGLLNKPTVRAACRA